MTYSEAIRFLFDLQMFGARFGLDTTRKLASLAGHPEQRLRFIHVAGTNGKGSTCAMLESIYRAAGFRVGLFTSPHLVSFSERIQVNRQLMPEGEVIRQVGEIRALIQQGWGDLPNPAGFLESPQQTTTVAPDEAIPTFFEAVTVMALRYFAAQACDLVIWETGLGGRLDATNIVTPLASVITNIDFDHQQWLGNSLRAIATEKAGIIKPGVPVITGASQPEALEVIAATAQRNDALLTVIDRNDAAGTLLDAVKLPLLGEHQRLNAAIAVATARALGSQLPVAHETILDGLSAVRWPGRMQLTQTKDGRTILLDGAHNEASARALAEAFGKMFPDTRPTLILGVLADKDWRRIAEILAPIAGRLLLVPVKSARTLSPAEMVSVCNTVNPRANVQSLASLQEALEQSAGDPFVLITGSLYLVGEALQSLDLSTPSSSDERGLNEWHLRTG